MTVNLSQAKAHLGRFIKRVGKGETVIICERNRPVAKLSPLGTDTTPRKVRVGIWKGQFKVPEGFDAAMPDFEQDFYGEK